MSQGSALAKLVLLRIARAWLLFCVVRFLFMHHLGSRNFFAQVNVILSIIDNVLLAHVILNFMRASFKVERCYIRLTNISNGRHQHAELMPIQNHTAN